ncbi:hypothetical protein FHS31_002419 [Sphingomonas vulcanisoli]|uniref:DUF1837 domain-containing protein n=1 Tax=Sphingomonas vulcanisoli TaxID=1658060 RepID=A0ABX0TWH5_9SPHN|nr:hypothetical protein [Sphingomonas vulcanisoli]NIJ08795.1 hypothetical protein [Sphingomonas vulcanisoli]
MSRATEADARYRELLLEPVRVCANYRPAFGTARGEEEITLDGFRRLFDADPLYSWLGLNSPLMYAAHKAAGGMTSIYRQIGIGCERLVRGVIQDSLSLDDTQVRWGYDSLRSDGRQQRLTLDARIDSDHLGDPQAVERLKAWLKRSSEYVNQHRDTRGAVFEVRQGYKSADSKRQNADLRFGLAAYDEAYLPVILVISTQVSSVVIERYRQNKLLVLTGNLTKDDTRSTYAFFETVIGYSLTKFFERNAPLIREQVTYILERLLSPA